MEIDEGVTILNFDDTYEQQPYLKEKQHEWIHLTNLTSVKKLCCNDSLKKIEKRLSERKSRAITLIGSGDYHYVTYLLLKEIRVPFSLILFDNHPDFQETSFSQYISCGSWVLKALENVHLLEHVTIIGPSENLLKYSPIYYSDKLSFFPKENFSQVPKQCLIEKIINSIPTSLIYISIDKDVLDRRDACTNWDHGLLRLSTLLEMLSSLSIHKVMIGADICGEYSYSPLQHIDHEIKEAISLNGKANKLLIDRLLHIIINKKTLHTIQ